MKKLLLILLALCLACGLCACGDDDEEVNPIFKIGVFEPLTGAYAGAGAQEVLGIEYAHSVRPTVKIGGQTYDVELVQMDNASSATKAAEVAQSLVDEGVSIILGSYSSELSLAAGPVFERAGITALGISCTNPQLTTDNDSYYRVCIQDELQGAAIAQFAKTEHEADNVYCFGQTGNVYDQGLIAGFKAKAEELGISVTQMDFAENCTDFSYLLFSAKEGGADMIFAPCSLGYAKLMLDQAMKHEIGLPFIGGDTWDDNSLLDAAIGKNFRIYVSAFYALGGKESFEDAFEDWIEDNETALANNGGSKKVAAITVMGYDAYNVALDAAEKAGSPHHADILAIMPSVGSSGVSGMISFDDVGDAVRSGIYIKRADTEIPQWKFVKNQKIS